MSPVAGYVFDPLGTLWVRLPGGGRRRAGPREAARFWRSASGIALAAAMAEVPGEGTGGPGEPSAERQPERKVA